MYLGKKPAVLKLIFMSGKQTFNETALLVQQGNKELLPDWYWGNHIIGYANPIEQEVDNLLIKKNI